MKDLPLELNLTDAFFISNLKGKMLHKLINNDHFLLFWTESKDLEIQTIFNKIQIEKGTLYLWGPDEILTINGPQNMECYCLGFTIDFIQTDANDYLMDIFNLFYFEEQIPTLHLEAEEIQQLNAINNLIFTEFERVDKSQAILHAYLKAILLMLIRAKKISHNKPNINIQRLHDFFILVYEHFREQQGIAFYANKLNISTKRLNQILHSYFRKSAGQLIQEILILESKRLLISGKYTINEISDQLGFTERAYFSRFFKKRTGVSPNQFNNKND